MNNRWTVQEDDLCRKMAISGRLPHEMAMALNRSNDAVLGYCRFHRIPLNYEKKKRYVSKFRRQKNGMANKNVIEIRKVAYVAIPDWQPTSCQYIHGEARNRKFCDKPLHYKSWCEEHARVCFL